MGPGEGIAIIYGVDDEAEDCAEMVGDVPAGEGTEVVVESTVDE